MRLRSHLNLNLRVIDDVPRTVADVENLDRFRFRQHSVDRPINRGLLTVEPVPEGCVFMDGRTTKGIGRPSGPIPRSPGRCTANLPAKRGMVPFSLVNDPNPKFPVCLQTQRGTLPARDPRRAWPLRDPAGCLRQHRPWRRDRVAADSLQ